MPDEFSISEAESFSIAENDTRPYTTEDEEAYRAGLNGVEALYRNKAGAFELPAKEIIERTERFVEEAEKRMRFGSAAQQHATLSELNYIIGTDVTPEHARTGPVPHPYLAECCLQLCLQNLGAIEEIILLDEEPEDELDRRSGRYPKSSAIATLGTMLSSTRYRRNVSPETGMEIFDFLMSDEVALAEYIKHHYTFMQAKEISRVLSFAHTYAGRAIRVDGGSIEGVSTEDYEELLEAFAEVCVSNETHYLPDNGERLIDYWVLLLVEYILEDEQNELLVEGLAEKILTKLTPELNAQQKRKIAKLWLLSGSHTYQEEHEKNYENLKRPALIERNIATLKELSVAQHAIEKRQSKEPEQSVGATLYKEFGIACFGRYPTQMLRTQFEQRDDTNLEYGVLMCAYADHNGAFHQAIKVFEGAFDDARALNAGIRIVEAGGPVDAAKALLRLDNRYGSSKKINFGLVGAHGDELNIYFLGDEASAISKKHIEAPIAKRIVNAGPKLSPVTGKAKKGAKSRKLFKDGATLGLISCNTGVPKGIGNTIYGETGLRVIAPKKEAGIDKIELTRDEKSGLIVPELTYSEEDSQVRYGFPERPGDNKEAISTVLPEPELQP